MYTMEHYSAIKKEYIWISSNEVDETGANYTEWGKPESALYLKEQISIDNKLTLLFIQQIFVE